MNYVAKRHNLTQLSNGYFYKADRRMGYKFDNGSICVALPAKELQCVRVKTDGKRFWLVDGEGSRTRF